MITEDCPPGLKDVEDDDISCRTCKYGKWGGDSEHRICEKYDDYDYWDSVCDSYTEMPADALREDIEPPNIRRYEKVCGNCKHSRFDFEAGACRCKLYYGHFDSWAVCDSYEPHDADPNEGFPQWGGY